MLPLTNLIPINIAEIPLINPFEEIADNCVNIQQFAFFEESKFDFSSLFWKTASKIYQSVTNFPWKVYFAFMCIVAVKQSTTEGTYFYNLQKDLEAFLNRSEPTSLKSYQADKNLASQAPHFIYSNYTWCFVRAIS